MLLANHEKDDWIEGEKTEDVVAFGLYRFMYARLPVPEGAGDTLSNLAAESRQGHQDLAWIESEKTEDVVAFLDRLYTAKRKVEERIVVLGGGEDTSVVCDS